MKSETSLSAITCGTAQIYKIDMKPETLQKLKSHAFRALENHDNYKDHTYSLAGHIKQGKQLLLPLNEEFLKDYVFNLKWAAEQYYHNYLDVIGRRNDPVYQLRQLSFEDTWLNSYYAGDYNPVHDHGTISPIGLSSFTFINTPDSIKSVYELKDRNISRSDPDVLDGHTTISWGYRYHSSEQEVESLQYPAALTLYPEEGTTYLFPKWMDHQVYPFRGDGVRITMATNISIWPVKYASSIPQPTGRLNRSQRRKKKSK